jgi:signal transduction histidine kinase
MGTLIRSHDWEKTSLGSPDAWPQSLRTVVNILLTSRYAMWLGWGESLSFLYNNAYRPTLGLKHPWALGTPAAEVWAEIWREVGPRVQTVLSTGEATYDEGLLLFLERSGFPEETYHTFSYSPLADDSGRVSGMLCVVTEETERVISERRMATLRDLAAGLASSNTEAEVLEAVERQLGQNCRDLPFTLTYLYVENGEARLARATGMPGAHAAAPERIEAGADAPWPAAEMFRHPAPQLKEDLVAQWGANSLPRGAWDKSPDQAMVVPIKQQGHERPAGFIVVGLNPYRRFSAAYSGFLDLIAGQVAAGLANARAYDEERRRAESLAELDRAKTAFFSNVSHEFRTPLTLMLGPIEDLLGKDSENRDLLQGVYRSGLRLQRLVNTLLDFSRIEAGRAQASYQPTDLATFTTELASSFRSAMERAGLEFTVKCAPLSQPVHIDHEMWEKVVLNLLSNAFKYTLEGSVTVRLTEREGRVELTITDTGAGIPEEEVPRLFERFHRVEQTRAARTKARASAWRSCWNW